MTADWDRARAVADGNLVLDAEGGFRVEFSPPSR